MKEYLNHHFSTDDKDLISIIDELPLWSAPFGLSLLNTIKVRKQMKVLDIGSGLGFPLIEIAQRLGESSIVFGIDPWKEANERAKLKINKYSLTNVKVINGTAENLPFENSYFDLIVSNNGINNVEDIPKTLKECRRVGKQGCQFVFTMNLEDSMIEFYSVLREELAKRNMPTEIEKMHNHIYQKRKPLEEIKKLLTESGFKIYAAKENIFYLRFSDGTTMFNHSFIKYWFLPSWKSIVEYKDQEEIFSSVEVRLNKIAATENEIRLSIPFAVFDCVAE